MIDLFITLVYVLVTALVGLVTIFVIYARWHYGTLEKIKAVPVVIKPAFVGGSDLYLYKKVVHDQDTENFKKYGKIYGFYEGRAPHVYIADADLVRAIFIKDFDHFQDKRVMDFGHDLINEMMDILPYKKWKIVRSYISPSLTTGKIRNMSLQMTETIDEWMETVKTKLSNNEPFEPKRMYTALTSDVISRCGFGAKVNSLHDPNSIFTKHLKNLSLENAEPNFLLTCSYVLPFLSRLIPFFPAETLEFFDSFLKNVMKSRRGSKTKTNDFVDTLNEMLEKLDTEEYKKVGIRETTVTCQAIIFFLAGFETTASTLSLLTYSLAKNPDVQEKLLAELDAYLARHGGKIEHETIGELVYMSACIQETLRMYPPLIRIERVCTKEWHHEPSGLHIPKGVVIQVPVGSIHYNEEYYQDPYTFKPERFLPENKDKIHPCAFLAFGAGNHNCIGMRFAKEEIHLAMANVLKNYSFKSNAGTKVKFLPGRPMLSTLEAFTVDVIKRN